MKHANNLYRALGLDPSNTAAIKGFAKSSGLTVRTLARYNELNLLPSDGDLHKICKTANISPELIMLSMGHLNRRIIEGIQKNAPEILTSITEDISHKPARPNKPKVAYKSAKGRLYQGDCLDLMANLPDAHFDLIFADPPFNLSKLYPSGIDDNLKEQRYIEWCEEWLEECVRLLKPGGSLFLWNLPRWNTYLAAFLNSHLTFRHWIAVDMKYNLPIRNRLYPSHYSLLYYCKGDKPTIFHPDRLPMDICPQCKTDLKDYGGYKDKMNPLGVNLTDVWWDITPVRHAKYKKRKDANELPLKLLDRILELASNEDSHVFDPFGGSGSTYVVAELKKRRWTGIEIGPVEGIIERIKSRRVEHKYLESIRQGYNKLFTESDEKERIKRGLWTCETIKAKRSISKKKILDSGKSTS